MKASGPASTSPVVQDIVRFLLGVAHNGQEFAGECVNSLNLALTQHREHFYRFKQLCYLDKNHHSILINLKVFINFTNENKQCSTATYFTEPPAKRIKLSKYVHLREVQGLIRTGL